MAEHTETDDFDSVFNPDNVPASNWFKFEKVGDKIVGELVEFHDNVESRVPNYPAQRVFGLKTKDGSIVKVGISMDKDYIIGRTNSVQLGDLIGFEYKKDVPSARGKGFRDAKSIEVYVKKAAAPVSSTE